MSILTYEAAVAECEAWVTTEKARLLAEYEPFEPTPQDLADYHQWSESIDRRWREEQIERGPAPEDVEEAYQICRAQDRLEQANLFTDADLMAGGLPPG